MLCMCLAVIYICNCCSSQNMCRIKSCVALTPYPNPTIKWFQKKTTFVGPMYSFPKAIIPPDMVTRPLQPGIPLSLYKNENAAYQYSFTTEDSNPRKCKDWFYKLNMRCDQYHVDCIIDKRLENRYTYLKQQYNDKVKKSGTEYLRNFEAVLYKLKEPLELSSSTEPANWNYSSPSEFEILIYMKTRVSSNLSEAEILKIALNQKQPLLCRWLLLQNEQFEIELALLLTMEDKDILKPMAWYYTRLFYQTYNVCLLAASNIWPGQICCCTSKRYEAKNCTKNGIKLIVVESEQNLEKLPNKYFGFKIYNHVKSGQNAESEFGTILQKQLFTNEDSYYIHNNVSSESAEILFKAHTNLTMILGFPFKSKGFGLKHHIGRDHVVKLFCRKKGIIPIGENHFSPCIDGVETNVLEGCPTLAANLHVGDAIGPYHSRGTLGGFYEHMGRACFLTCAHVMYDVQNLLKSPYDVTKHEAVKAYLHTPSGPTECGSIIRRIFEHDDPNVTSVDAALVEIKSSACIVDPNDYVRDSGNNACSFHTLGLMSVSLHENCLDHTRFSYASNVLVVAPGSTSKHEQPVDFVMNDATDVCFKNIGQVVAQANGTAVRQLMFAGPVHMQAPVGPIPARIFRMYKQININMPLQAGDSGTCVYINGGPGLSGCIGMAIAFDAGFSIVTPLKDIIGKL